MEDRWAIYNLCKLIDSINDIGYYIDNTDVSNTISDDNKEVTIDTLKKLSQNLMNVISGKELA